MQRKTEWNSYSYFEKAKDNSLKPSKSEPVKKDGPGEAGCSTKAGNSTCAY
jgi:hypothetical protein